MSGLLFVKWLIWQSENGELVLKITYIARISVPIEVNDGVCTCTSPTRRSIESCVFQVGLGRLLQISLLNWFSLPESLSYTVCYYHLLASTMALRRALRLNVAVPIQVCKCHSVLHLYLELCSLLQTLVKLLVILLQVGIVKARRASICNF